MKKGGANFIEASRGPRIDHTRGEKRNNFVLSLRVCRRIWIMKSARPIMALRMRPYGTGRIFDRVKDLTVHFVSHGTVQYFRSVRTELYNRTVKVLPCERNTETHQTRLQDFFR